MVPGSSRSPPEPPEERPGLLRQTRVRMSALGAVRCPNLAGREGVVVGAGRYRSTVRIMFDGSGRQPRCTAPTSSPWPGKKAPPAGIAASFAGFGTKLQIAKQFRVQERSCLPDVCSGRACARSPRSHAMSCRGAACCKAHPSSSRATPSGEGARQGGWQFSMTRPRISPLCGKRCCSRRGRSILSAGTSTA